jgi:hypothetical protein
MLWSAHAHMQPPHQAAAAICNPLQQHAVCAAQSNDLYPFHPASTTTAQPADSVSTAKQRPSRCCLRCNCHLEALPAHTTISSIVNGLQSSSEALSARVTKVAIGIGIPDAANAHRTGVTASECNRTGINCKIPVNDRWATLIVLRFCYPHLQTDPNAVKLRKIE